MSPKGSFVIVLFLVFVNSGYFFGPVCGVVVKDRDVWSSSLEKKMKGSARKLEVRFDDLATHWTDALPIGNGRLGAMIWGGVANETINLNEETLWTGNPGTYTDPNAPNIVSNVRKLVDDRQFFDASVAANGLGGNPSEVYQLLGDMKLEFDLSHASYNQETYQRVLDLDTATVKMQYSANGVTYTREHFASYPDQVIVIKISGNKHASLNFTISFDSQMQYRSYVNGRKQLIMEGSCPGARIPPPGFTRENNLTGIQYSAVLDIQINERNGQLKVLDGGKLRVEACDWAVIRLTASSSFAGPFTRPMDSKIDTGSKSLNLMESAKRYSYSDLHARHVDDYQALFHRVSLQLSKSSSNSSSGNKFRNLREITTAQRIASFKDDEDPSVIELVFQYGRYLMIACSRPGTQPSNLQGIWNRNMTPSWDGAPHLNINLQMNYWPSLSCNLEECQEPLFDFIKSLSINGYKTAKVNYGARGWVTHHVSDIWAKTSPDYGSPTWFMWPMGGAWLAQHFWEHYTYTLDKEFLRNKAYPLMEGSTTFLLDWLIDKGPGEFLQTNPSTSPEHNFTAPDGRNASVSYSSTMDVEILNEVFSAMLLASEELGKSDDDLIAKIRKAQPRLRPLEIAEDGSLMEWAEDFWDPVVQHRHLSHLFGLFPGHSITPEKTPELCKAAENSLIKRGEIGPGWSTTWKAALWARLHNSDRAYHMVKHLIDLVDPDRESFFKGGLYANLFGVHPPFQIDGNFGFTAAVAEMLVQSTVKDLYLLPALPRDIWVNGCVKGLKARGGITLSFCWKEGNLDEVGLWSRNRDVVKVLHYNGVSATVNISSGVVYTFNQKLDCVKTLPLL